MPRARVIDERALSPRPSLSCRATCCCFRAGAPPGRTRPPQLNQARTTHGPPTCPIMLQRPVMPQNNHDRPSRISTPFILSEACADRRSGKRRRLGTAHANRHCTASHDALSCACASRLPIAHRKSVPSGWASWTGQPVCCRAGPPVGLCRARNADRAPVTEARMMRVRPPQRAWVLFPGGRLLVATRGCFES